MRHFIEFNYDNFNLRLYYIYFLYFYDQNLNLLLLELSKLKKDCDKNLVNEYHFFQVELKIESMFMESYKEARKLDGRKKN